MKPERSWTRQQYEQAYSFLRRVGDEGDVDLENSTPQQIWRAADYSYQAKDYEVHGWSNSRRRKRFHAIKYRAFSFAEDIPF